MEYKDLKIQFRSVIFSGKSRVLEYRVHPDQDLTYYKEYSFLGIKWRRKKKYSTDWIQPTWFRNYPFSYKYTEDDSIINPPIFLNKIDSDLTLEFFKSNFQTMGEFMNFVDKHNQKEVKAYRIERKKYLDDLQPIY